MKSVRAWIKHLAQLGEQCMYCKLNQHCKGCGCCMQRP